MPGVKSLRKIQLGVEATAGTAVAATTIWRGLGTMEDVTPVVFDEEDIGYLSGVDRTHVPMVRGQLAMEPVEATFEQLPYILEAGVKSVAGVQDAPGSGYVYTFPFPTTAINTIKTYTLEGGDNQQAEEMAYCFVTGFSIKGAADESLKMSADWIGRQISTTTFTAALSLPSVEDILFNKGKVYIDAVGGSIGGTVKSNTMISMSLDVDTGLRAYTAADGQLYFSAQKSIGPEVMLEIIFEHDGTSVAEKANWLAETARQIRLIFEGSALTTPQVYTYKTLIIDVAGKWEKFGKLEERDGNDVVSGTFRARYNSTAALFAEIVVVNELAALP